MFRPVLMVGTLVVLVLILPAFAAPPLEGSEASISGKQALNHLPEATEVARGETLGRHLVLATISTLIAVVLFAFLTEPCLHLKANFAERCIRPLLRKYPYRWIRWIAWIIDPIPKWQWGGQWVDLLHRASMLIPAVAGDLWYLTVDASGYAVEVAKYDLRAGTADGILMCSAGGHEVGFFHMVPATTPNKFRVTLKCPNKPDEVLEFGHSV